MDWEVLGFAGGCAAFLGLAVLGTLQFSWLSFPSPLSLAIYFLGTALVVGGYFLGKRVKVPPLPLLWGVLLLVVLSLYLYPLYGARGLVAAFFLIAALVAVVEGLPGKELFTIGAAGMLVNFYFSGVPLLEPASRGGYTSLGAVSLVLLLLGINQLAQGDDRKFKLFFAAGLALAVLTAYRSVVVLVALTPLITRNHVRKIEPRKWAIIGASLALVVLLVGQINAFEGEENPLLLVTRRAGFTYERFDQIVNTLTPHPGLWFEGEPRYVIGQLTLGEHKIINAGLYGFMWLDGGVVELVLGSILAGFGLGHFRRNREMIAPFYSMIIIYFLLSIEAGFDLVYLVGFLGALFAIGWKTQ